MRIHFAPTRINGHTYPELFLKTIAELPVAKEQYEYVNKRIAGWESYLKVLYKNANIDDIEASIQSISYCSDFFSCLPQTSWHRKQRVETAKGMNAYLEASKMKWGSC